AWTGRVSEGAGLAVRTALYARNSIVPCSDVVKNIRSALGEPVERRIDIAQPWLGLITIGYYELVEQRHDSRKGGRSGGRAANNKIQAGRHHPVAIVNRGGERNVRHIPGIVIGNTGTGLPGWLRKINARSAAGGQKSARVG